MARRSSARLRSRQSPTPQRVSLSHDAPLRTPRTAPSKLFSVKEADEVPGAFPESPTPQDISTPKDASPIQPTDEQMHPQLHHPSTVQPSEEARHLGFFSMPAKSEHTKVNAGGTPSKTSNQRIPSQPVFTFRRENSLQLSPAAKQLMLEKREEAVRIREQMVAESSGNEDVATVQGRKAAEGKTKKGRFSDAHASAFNKMASIANHASSFRTQPKTTITVTTPSRDRTLGGALKRSPSKAELDPQSSTPKTEQATPSRNTISTASGSPAKRVKRAETDDVATGRKGERNVLSTPVGHDSHTNAVPIPAGSTPSVKTRIPGPLTGPSKTATPKPAINKDLQSPHLFAKSATKANIFPPRVGAHSSKTEVLQQPALLSQSPVKATPKKKAIGPGSEQESKKEKNTPLLLRSPFKKPVSNGSPTTASKETAIPMFSRSPSKLPFKRDADKGGKDDSNATPGKNLLGRFNLLRASPQKGILRTPQRLYSDDPEKIAAGTHFATPEKMSSEESKPSVKTTPKSCSPLKRVDFTNSTKARQLEQQEPGSKSPQSKRQAKSGDAMEPASVIAEYPTLPGINEPTSPSPQKRRQTTGPVDFTFRANEMGIVFGNSPKAQNNAVSTARPLRSIRHVSSDAVASSQAAMGSKKRKFDFESAMVMPKEVDVNKENDAPVSVEEVEEERPAKRRKPLPDEKTETKVQEKKTMETKGATGSKVTSRAPTLGVKPKGSKPAVKDTKKRPSTISQARLNALSQPKRRA